MTPEQWLEVERLYYAALERDADARAAFLTDACAGDDALRQEVESLFAYQTKARDFIETPAGHIRLASALRGLEQPSVAGRFVGRGVSAAASVLSDVVDGAHFAETISRSGGKE